MILLPVWLAAIDLAGAQLLASQYPWTVGWILKTMGYAHFCSLAFMLLCGVTIRTLLATGIQVPRLLGGLALLASLSFLAVDHDLGHALSHALFDSCGGYDDHMTGAGIILLIPAAIILLRSSHAGGSMPHVLDEDADAATP